MDMKKSSMSSQNRLILYGFLACTTVIVLIAILAMNAIQKNMNKAYRSFGQIIAKTLAIESVEVTKDIPDMNKYDTLRTKISNSKITNQRLFTLVKAIFQRLLTHQLLL